MLSIALHIIFFLSISLFYTYYAALAAQNTVLLVGLLHGCGLQAVLACNLVVGLLPAYCHYFKMSLINISVRVEDGSDLC